MCTKLILDHLSTACRNMRRYVRMSFKWKKKTRQQHEKWNHLWWRLLTVGVDVSALSSHGRDRKVPPLSMHKKGPHDHSANALASSREVLRAAVCLMRQMRACVFLRALEHLRTRMPACLLSYTQTFTTRIWRRLLPSQKELQSEKKKKKTVCHNCVPIGYFHWTGWSMHTHMRACVWIGLLFKQAVTSLFMLRAAHADSHTRCRFNGCWWAPLLNHLYSNGLGFS